MAFRGRPKRVNCNHSSRKPLQREKMCYNKHRHYTIAAALSAASYDSTKYGVAMTAYHCPICKYYHITRVKK